MMTRTDDLRSLLTAFRAAVLGNTLARLVAMAIAVMLGVTGVARADVDAGAKLGAACAHCHGTDGNSSSGAYPNIAGQNKEYIAKQIRLFKEGKRKNSQMSPMVGILSDENTRDLGEFYAAQGLKRGSFQPDPKLAVEGKKIAEERQCATCHLPAYRGAGEIPRLTRQKHTYLIKQLKDYRDGLRTSDEGVMSANVKGLTDEQIEALVHYISTL